MLLKKDKAVTRIVHNVSYGFIAYFNKNSCIYAIGKHLHHKTRLELVDITGWRVLGTVAIENPYDDDAIINAVKKLLMKYNLYNAYLSFEG